MEKKKYEKPIVLDLNGNAANGGPLACISGSAATGGDETCGTGTNAGYTCSSGTNGPSGGTCYGGNSPALGEDCFGGSSAFYCGAWNTGTPDPSGCRSGPTP